jgi:hypothetical protein
MVTGQHKQRKLPKQGNFGQPTGPMSEAEEFLARQKFI